MAPRLRRRSPTAKQPVLAALLGLLSAAGGAAFPAATLSLRLEDMAVWRTRLEWSGPEFRVVYAERRGGRQPAGRGARGLVPAQWAIGMDCPWLAGGAVRPTGLLRQLADPLGFGPDSGVYREGCGLAIDAAMDPGPRRGGELRLCGGGLRLLALREGDPGSGARAGAALDLGAGQGVRLQVVGLLGRPGLHGSGAEWFLARAPYPGGLLGHGGAQLRVQAGALTLRCSGAVSGGQRVGPGAWGSLSCALGGRRLEGLAQAAACSAGYREPGGGTVEERGQAAVLLRARAGCAAELQLGASRRLEAAQQPAPALRGAAAWQPRWVDRAELTLRARRLPGGAAASPRPVRPGDPRCELRLELCAERRGGPEAPALYVGQCRVCVQATRSPPGGRADGDPAARSSRLSLEVSAGASAPRGAEGAWQAALSLCWRREGEGALSLQCRARLEEHGAPAVELAASLQRPGARLYGRLEVRDVPAALRALGPEGGGSGCCALTVGWETRCSPGGGGSRAPGAPRAQPSESSHLAVWK